MGSLYSERCGKQIDRLSGYFGLIGTTGASVLIVWLGWPGQRAFDLLHPNQGGDCCAVPATRKLWRGLPADTTSNRPRSERARWWTELPRQFRIATIKDLVVNPAESIDRRRYPRLLSPKGTIVAWHSTNKRVVSAVDNFGLGGLYIRTPDPPATGTFIQLLLDAPTGEVRARAVAQRSRPKDGMGVKLVAMEQEDRARFARWLRTLSS